MASVFLLFLYILAFCSISVTACEVQTASFLFDLKSQCPLSISSNPPLEVDGDFLDRALTSKQGKSFTSVLFYASWCPFSHKMHPKFEMLASMFPQVQHMAVEKSAALPSVFSKYGIHSLPSILIVNQTFRARYHGPKNIQSLIQFYEKSTGLKPAQYLVEDVSSSEGSEKSIMQPWDGSSFEEIIEREPYLVFATLFLCLRVLLYLSPKVLSHLKSFWVSHIRLHFNLEIFGETSQLLFGRILHMIDVRRIWTKLRLCKTRNFRAGAKTAGYGLHPSHLFPWGNLRHQVDHNLKGSS